MAGGGLLTVFAMWWLYFARPAHAFLAESSVVASFLWGYGHYAVFAAGAAVGAGIAVNVDYVTHHAHTSTTAAAAAFTVPVAVFLLVLWFLHVRPHHAGARHALLFPAAAALVLAATVTRAGYAVPAAGVVTAGLVAAGIMPSVRAWTSPPTS